MAIVLLSTTGAGAVEVDNKAVTSSLTYGVATRTNASVQAELQLVPEIDLTLTKRTALLASARIRLDAFDKLAPGKPNYDAFSAVSKPLALGNTGSAELRDFFFEVRSDNGRTRLGKQQIVWGRLDGIKVLDLINPQSFREFIIEDFASSRIGLWSAYFDYSLGNWRTELAVIADGTGHEIPGNGAWFELTAPRFRFGALQGQASPAVTTINPGITFDDTAIGLRLSRQLGTLDFSVVAYSGNDPEPLGRAVTVNGTPVVERFYERRDAFGFSFDLGLGPAVLRAEYAYQPQRMFNTRFHDQLTTTTLDQRRGAIGVDLDGPLGLFINLQYLVDTVSDAPSDLVRPASDRVATLFLRRSFAYDALAVEVRCYHSFTDKDRLASIGIRYDLNDSSALKLTAQHFAGTAAGLFGQFEGRGRITLSLNHVF